MRGPVFAAFGNRRLDEITRGELKELAGSLRTTGAKKQTVKNVITAVAALYRYANDHGWTRANPTRSLGLPGGRSTTRGRYLSPKETAALVEALPERDRPLWATAIYAGLRRGELMGLRWDDVDLGGRTILVRRQYDQVAKAMTAPKSDAGEREVPIPAVLAELLLAHRLREPGGGRRLVFARGSLAGTCRRGCESRPFSATSLARRAKAAWRARGLDPMRMHEGRHAYASTLIAGGAGDSELQAVVGHSSVQTTKDIYGHLRDDTTDRLRRLLDEHLEAHDGRVTSQEAIEGIKDLEAWLAAQSGS
jgi:integrase